MPNNAVHKKPIVIAHRGASGYLPEHTLAAYSVAILQGADFIEPDLVMTRDGELIARHDNRLDLTTDIAARPEFARRRGTKEVDGVSVTGWFSEDFTLAEIKQLRAVERIPDIRPANRRFDGQFTVPTLREILELVRAYEKLVGRSVGIYPETKHPTHFDRLGLPLEPPLVALLREHGYTRKEHPVYLQSFEPSSLQKLRALTPLPLIQLLDEAGAPTYDDMATPEGLARVAAYADGIGPNKERVIARDGANRVASPPTDLVRDAHAAGLLVHAYTFRAENFFLPVGLRRGADPTVHGDLDAEIRAFLTAGIDGLFVDHPPIARRAVDGFRAP
jgi:glycerophosphoryl diester phosphodiesterase